MSLAALVKNRKAEQKNPLPSLLPRVDELLMLRPGDDRRDGYFHPSDLSYDFCPRAWCLYNWHPGGLSVKEGGFPPRIKRVFDNGHDLHARYQRYFQEMGLLWGRWRKVVGADTEGNLVYEHHVGFAPKTTTGDVDLAWEYMEVKLRHEQDNILGSTDGILRLKGFSRHGFEYGKWGLELKSINSRGFGWLPESRTPGGAKDHHRDQTLIYSHALEEERALGKRSWWHGVEGSDFWEQPLEGFIVLYENKDTQDVREFVIPFERSKIDAFFSSIRPLMDEALAFKEGERDKYPRCACGKDKSALCKAFHSA